MTFGLFIRGGKSFTEQHKNAKESGKKETSESSELKEFLFPMVI